MDRLAGVVTEVATWFLLMLLAGLAVEALSPILTRLTRLYTPPHGAYVLAGTWLAAFVSVGLALTVPGRSVGARSAALLVPVFLALCASFVHRDERRRVRGLPELADLPDRFGWRGRIGLVAFAVLSALTALAAAWASGWKAWEPVLACLVGAGAAGVAAITGRLPRIPSALVRRREGHHDPSRGRSARR
jgi:hypothetical protein